MKRTILIFSLLLTSLALTSFTPLASAAIKSGSTCKVAGQTVFDSGKKYRCVKSGKKLVWDKGSAVVDSNSQKKDPSVSKNGWPSLDAKYITAVPVDLDQINSISKYASCSGHNRDGYTFDKTLVSNASLKHYFFPILELQGTTDKVKVFAPFDGKVDTIFLEADKKGQGRPKNGNGLGLSTPIDQNVLFTFGHIYFTKNFRVGDLVKAGDFLGFASLAESGFDFDIDLTGKSRAPDDAEILGSIFDHMTKEVLATFAEHGITPSDMKISIAERKTNPCDFSAGVGRTSKDWVVLKGQLLEPKDSGTGTFQEKGTFCDPKKETIGKARDGTKLFCNVGADLKSSWQ